MSYAYINNLVNNVVPGKFKTLAVSSLQSAGRATVTKTLNQVRCTLPKEIGIFDEIVPSLLDIISSADMKDDVKIPNFDDPSDIEYTFELSDEVANTLMESIYQLSGDMPMHVSCGQVPIMLVRDIVDGYPELHTQAGATTFREKFIFRLNGKYYCNPRLKSEGFYRQNQNHNIPTTIQGAINLICDYNDYNCSNLKDFVIAVGSNTLAEAVETLIEEYELTSTGLLFDDLLAVEDHLWNNYSRRNYGVRVSLTQLTRSSCIASTLKKVMLTAIDIHLRGFKNVQDLYCSLNQWINEKAAVISDFINGLINAFNDGGWYGSAMYIIDCIKGIGSLNSTEDGVLVYTNNQSLIPAQYIGTMVCRIIGAVTSLVGAVLTAIQPAIGAIITLIGSIIGAIPMAFNYDYKNSTTATIIDAENAVLNYSPVAMMQGTIPISGDLAEIAKICKEQCTLMYCEVPGGMLLLGADTSDVKLRYEFHSLLGRVPGDLTGLTFGSYQTPGQWKTYTDITIPSDYTYNTLANAWFNNCNNATAFENSGGSNKNCLTGSDDLLLREAILHNFAIFLLWLWLKENPVRTTEYIRARDTDWDGSAINPIWAWYTADPKYFFSWLNTSAGGDTQGNISWAKISSIYADQAKSISNSISIDAYYIDEPYVANQHTYAIDDFGSVERQVFYMNYNHFTTDALSINNFSWGCEVPKYDRSTFLTWVLLSTLAVAAVTVLTVTMTLKIKKWRYNKRMQQTAKVTNAYDTYTTSYKDYDPDDPQDKPEYHTPEYRREAYNAYYKQVKANNRWAIVTGGTTYSYAGYWDSDMVETSPDDEWNYDTSSLSSDDTGTILNSSSNSVQDNVTLNDIVNLIRGKPIVN